MRFGEAAFVQVGSRWRQQGFQSAMTQLTAATTVKILRLAVRGTRGFTSCTDMSIPECVVLVPELVVALPAADCLVNLGD